MGLSSLRGLAGTTKEIVINLDGVIEGEKRVFLQREDAFLVFEKFDKLSAYLDEFTIWLDRNFTRSRSLDDFIEGSFKVIINHPETYFDECDILKVEYSAIVNEKEVTKEHIIEFNKSISVFSNAGELFDVPVGVDWVRTPRDTIVTSNDEFGVVKANSKRNNHFTDKSYYLVFKHNGNPYEGMSKIPSNAKLSNNFIFDNCVSLTGFVATESNNVLRVKGNVTIKAEVPIECNDTVRIEGDENSVLHLISNGEKQPCIGPKTHTGMSYDRWSPAGSLPTRIEIDSCEVICESNVPSFTIGKYGENGMPEIVLLNGAKLTCPEMTGSREVIYQAKAPEDSTKILEDMEYGIRKEGQADWELSTGRRSWSTTYYMN